ncbi:MAG: hypothetical protein JXO72_12010 [Vicinamibacteria bacterium]|nr:hypothetical protein [Vicinamibacteria bacterium]
MICACRAPRIDPRTRNPCAYLTRAEAESVLEQPAQEERLAFDGPFAVCTYRGRNDRSRWVEFHLFRADRAPAGRRDAENLFEDALISADPSGFSMIDRIGDRAFFVPKPDRRPAQVGTLWVLKGSTLFRVRAGEIRGHEDWKMAKELARCVARRLPD